MQHDPFPYFVLAVTLVALGLLVHALAKEWMR